MTVISEIAFFDDFSHPVLGHHPELILGLAEAAATLNRVPALATTVYCPDTFVGQRQCRETIAYEALAVQWPVDLVQARQNRRHVCGKAHRERSLIYNCFFDDNYPVWTDVSGVNLVHHLHRPGFMPTNAFVGRPWPGDPEPLFVVNTKVGMRQASNFIAADRLLKVGWPASSREAVRCRFTAPVTPPDDEPYALLIGNARNDKGVDLLFEALAGGPLLRVTGQQFPGDQERLTAQFPQTRVAWQSGFVPSGQLETSIRDAAVVVFPYLPRFGRHGGASAALAQALAFRKPVLISDVLADQVPSSPACQLVPSSDPYVWRTAIERAIRESADLHLAARELQRYVEQVHTYEGCVESVLNFLVS